MLQKKFRLRKKSDFSRVFSGQLSYASKFAVIYILKGRPLKFGFVASKKIGNAVKRNRAKRLLREAVRLNMSKIKGENQMIFIARKSILKASLPDVEKEIIKIWRKAGVYNE
ncbi:MAG: ribonuclease P protein component [Desulfitobacteriia bacterium]|jgi:ribonuclease P protein component